MYKNWQLFALCRVCKYSAHILCAYKCDDHRPQEKSQSMIKTLKASKRRRRQDVTNEISRNISPFFLSSSSSSFMTHTTNLSMRELYLCRALVDFNELNVLKGWKSALLRGVMCVSYVYTVNFLSNHPIFICIPAVLVY